MSKQEKREKEDTQTNIQLLLYRMDRQELENREGQKEIMTILTRMEKGLNEVQAEVLKQDIRIKHIEDKIDNVTTHGESLSDHESRIQALETHRQLLIAAVITIGTFIVGQFALGLIKII